MNRKPDHLVRIVMLIAVNAVGACASALDRPDSEWRRERVARISAVSSLPPYVDTHCLSALPTSGASGVEAIVLHFRVGHATYYQAFPVAPGAAWRPGDDAEFVSRTCEMRRTLPLP